MTLDDIETIRDVAQRFRAAIAVGGLEWTEFARFPHGSCGVTCELLGEFLQEAGLGEWRFVFGQNDDPSVFRSHAWLDRDGLRIDITGDQFGGEPVVVTTEPLWVGQFAGTPGHVAGLGYYDLDAVAIRRDYQKLRDRMLSDMLR